MLKWDSRLKGWEFFIFTVPHNTATMDKEEFRPEGSTGDHPSGMFYRSWITGPQGAHYDLLKELQHSELDIMRAKAYIKRNFDAVSIKIIRESQVNLRV